jgi:hypothetical protein
MRNFRTVLSLPFVGVFYGLIYATGFVAWIANAVAGDEGVIKYQPVDESTGDALFTVDGDEQ